MALITLKFNTPTTYDKKGYLYFQITHRKTVRNIKSNYKLFKWEWSEKNGNIIKPSTKSPRYAILKDIIKNIDTDRQRLQSIIKAFEDKNFTYSANEIIATFHNLPKNNISFFDYARKHIAKQRKLGNSSTANNHDAALNSFIKYRKGQDIGIPSMSTGIVEEYEAYLKSRGNCRNTISFYMRNLRSIYNHAVEEHLTKQKNIFKHVYTGIDKTTKRAISLKDIRNLKNFDLTDFPKLEIARDLFIFSFYTRGMSFIDLAYLHKKDIVDNNLVYRRHKTGQQLIIRWEKEMQTITNRYSNPTKYLLPIIMKEDGTEYRQYKNAMMLINRKLKKIAKLAGISQTLSMYTSRHSWATIARNKNIPLSVISKGLGHDNDTNTQIYLASIETAEVDKANRKILQDLQKNDKKQISSSTRK